MREVDAPPVGSCEGEGRSVHMDERPRKTVYSTLIPHSAASWCTMTAPSEVESATTPALHSPVQLTLTRTSGALLATILLLVVVFCTTAPSCVVAPTPNGLLGSKGVSSSSSSLVGSSATVGRAFDGAGAGAVVVVVGSSSLSG